MTGDLHQHFHLPTSSIVLPQTPSIFITLRHEITDINEHQQTRPTELEAEKQSHEATQAELDNLKSKHTSMLTALALEKNHHARTNLRLSNLRADHEAAKQSYHSSARKLRDFAKLKHAAYISERGRTRKQSRSSLHKNKSMQS
jgi:t-SNARE complex subunit (syntaxin)